MNTVIDRNAAKKSWEILSGNLDGILTDFYNQIAKDLDGSLLAGIHIPTVKRKQLEHWKKIFLEDICEDYEKRISRMHIKHMEIGLSSRHYVSAYLYLLRQFHDCVFRTIDDVSRAEEMVRAIDQVVAKDLLDALTIFHETEIIDVAEGPRAAQSQAIV